MKLRVLILLSTLFFFGCAQAGNHRVPTAMAPKAKVWAFALHQEGELKLPKGFTEIRTRDQCRLYVFEPLVFSDVDITVKLKPNLSKKDYGAGILFRYQDPQNYYCVRYNPGINNFRFYKSIRGDRARFANRTVRLKDKTDWHELRLVSRGDLLQAYMDGKLVLSREDEILKKGKVGLWVRGEEPKTRFTEFVIRQ